MAQISGRSKAASTTGRKLVSGIFRDTHRSYWKTKILLPPSSFFFVGRRVTSISLNGFSFTHMLAHTLVFRSKGADDDGDDVMFEAIIKYIKEHFLSPNFICVSLVNTQ